MAVVHGDSVPNSISLGKECPQQTDREVPPPEATELTMRKFSNTNHIRETHRAIYYHRLSLGRSRDHFANPPNLLWD